MIAVGAEPGYRRAVRAAANRRGNRGMSSQTTLPSHFGRYQVVEELGQGGMGIVYLGVDPRLARPVAIKVIRESEIRSSAAREEYMERFRREAEAAGRLNHPDIVQIFDVGPTYLVMEYLEGQPLSSVLSSGAILTAGRAATLVLRIADAIDYAHDHGIVHRDIKPANVMLLRDGSVKVMDFGVARLAASNLTVAGTVLGSIRYMAPEQMLGEQVDARADIFSLAALAYELFTGHPPFPGSTISEVVNAAVHGRHVPPRQLDARLPDALDQVFAKGLARDPGRRHARAVELARDLHTSAQPVLDLVLGTDRPLAGSADAVTMVGVGPTQVGMLSTTRPAETLIQHPPSGRREGVLLLDSDPPGARVYLDGVPIGEAPQQGIAVTFGPHVVRMEATGRAPVSVELRVERERPLQALTVTLPLPRSGEAVRPGQLVPFGPHVTPPRRIAGALPTYPETARERGLEGAPVVEIWLGENGDVTDVAILESAGAALDGALLQAVASWRFTPATVAGVPVCVRFAVRHLFRG
jgi:TonB family protein